MDTTLTQLYGRKFNPEIADWEEALNTAVLQFQGELAASYLCHERWKHHQIL